MGHIELNTSNIKLCLGAAEVSAAYLGTEKVYPIEASEIPNYLSFTNKDKEDVYVGFAASPNANIENEPEFEYSYDGINWTTWITDYKEPTFQNTIIINPNKKIYLRGDNNYISQDNLNYYSFIFNPYANLSDTINVEAHGNIMSLLSKTNFENLTTVPDYCFYGLFDNILSSSSHYGVRTAPELPATTIGKYAYGNMFHNCDMLTQAPALPATTLAEYCYYSMFSGCKSLTETPELSAMALASYCYYSMFFSCTSLTQAPALPATSLTQSCYEQMFANCTSLTQAPALPATTLAYKCYSGMFRTCTSLTQAPALPATTLAGQCYSGMFLACSNLRTAPALPATTLADMCYFDMFEECTSLTQAPALSATTLTTYCYSYMFRFCTSLTQAPALPATTLANSCYYSMFQGCTSLTQAPALPATTLVSNCYTTMFFDCNSLSYVRAMFTKAPLDTYTKNWLGNVSSTGTFVMNPEATYTPEYYRGADGIPTGWTVTTASA